MQSKKLPLRAKTVFAIFVTLLLASIVVAAQTQATKFKVLHTFHGKDGAIPAGLLARDSVGNLYGTTGRGGDAKGLCVSFFPGCGTAFKLSQSGKLLWSHSFNFTDGGEPLAGLMRDSAGNLYGTTVMGGDTKCYQYGCGTVFKLDSAGKEKVLQKFSRGDDGEFPEALLARDTAGNLYGTTYDTPGTIFKVDATGNLTVLYTFTGYADGCTPYAGVILDASGNLYGAAESGGSGYCGYGDGVIFELDTTRHLTVLHTFGGGDGAEPDSVLLFDKSGNLYGTTFYGGSSNVCQNGCGTAFKLAPNDDGTWAESVLHSFCSAEACADGLFPERGPLAMDAAGNLYGTTGNGGTNGCGGYGCGVVYKLDTSARETVLYRFTGGTDGAGPFSGVTMDTTGGLYGVAPNGGDSRCAVNSGSGCGTVFELIPKK
jgi:uncharacterized repeat protein (TIGR03803 family)